MPSRQSRRPRPQSRHSRRAAIWRWRLAASVRSRSLDFLTDNFQMRGGGDRRLPRDAAQDLIGTAKGVLSAVPQHQELVANRQHAGAMSDQDDDPTAGLDVLDRLQQCHFALPVEIGVWLVE